MDAWEILYGNSTLVSGDAWEHLNAQEGGSEVCAGVILIDGLEITVEDACFDVAIDTADVGVDVASVSIDVEVDDNEIIAEVCDV